MYGWMAGHVSMNMLMPVIIHFPAQKEPISLENVGESPVGQTKLATSTISTMRAWLLVQTSKPNHWVFSVRLVATIFRCFLSGILTWLAGAFLSNLSIIPFNPGWFSSGFPVLGLE